MIYFIYITMALLATLAGSMTGIGGGVIMKPVMDAMGHYDAATISVLSSATVFTMSVVSVARQWKDRSGVKLLNFILLGVGSAGGGLAGQSLFAFLVSGAADGALIRIIQNAALCFLIVLVFLYMLFQSRIKGLSLKNPAFFLLAGLLLGVVSSFLGIGGGPINVALLMLLFSMDIKTAAFSSIVSIFFAQGTKLVTVACTTGYAALNLTVLPYMALAAVAGALLGSFLKRKLSSKVVTVCFNAVQIVIIGLTVYNIVAACV